MADEKMIRKQIRNVIQEYFTEEALKELATRSDLTINDRCDRIEKYVRDNVGVMDKRSRAIQGFFVNQVRSELQNEIFNASVTIDAFIAVIADAGIAIPDLAQKIDEKKKAIAADRMAKADAAMRAEMAARAEAAKLAKQAAPESTPAPSEEKATEATEGKTA